MKYFLTFCVLSLAVGMTAAAQSAAQTADPQERHVLLERRARRPRSRVPDDDREDTIGR